MYGEELCGEGAASELQSTLPALSCVGGRSTVDLVLSELL